MTEYVHNYPQGALQSEDEINKFVGGTLYSVHGLGEHSFLTEMKNVSEIRTEDVWGFRIISYIAITGDSEYQDYSCLGDLNIDKHYNSQYLFSDKAAAEVYLEWAKENTSRPFTPGVAFDYYDIDYPDDIDYPGDVNK
jgi:hypothetical protein